MKRAEENYQALSYMSSERFLIFQVEGDPIVDISLDKRGRLIHFNASHMILTWINQLYEETSMSHYIIPSSKDELRESTLGTYYVISDIDK